MTPRTGPVLVEGLVSSPSIQSAVRPRLQGDSPESTFGPLALPPRRPRGAKGLTCVDSPVGDPALPGPLEGLQ
jgi:hypothetical protein